MDHCVFCFHSAEPLLCRWEGTLRLEAADGPRKLEAVLFSIDTESRRCLSAQRVDIGE